MSALDSTETAAAPVRWLRPPGDGPEPDDGDPYLPAEAGRMPEDRGWPAADQPRSSLYVWAGSAGSAGSVGVPAPRRDTNFALDTSPVTARAVIGDELRRPSLWCELGACISRFSDAFALGEHDNHHRAHAVGWRKDAFGRWTCPGCLDRHPYWNAHPLIPRPVVLAELRPWAQGHREADRTAACGFVLSAVPPSLERDDADSGFDQIPSEPEEDDDAFWHRERSGRHRRSR